MFDENTVRLKSYLEWLCKSSFIFFFLAKDKFTILIWRNFSQVNRQKNNPAVDFCFKVLPKMIIAKIFAEERKTKFHSFFVFLSSFGYLICEWASFKILNFVFFFVSFSSVRLRIENNKTKPVLFNNTKQNDQLSIVNKSNKLQWPLEPFCIDEIWIFIYF